MDLGSKAPFFMYWSLFFPVLTHCEQDCEDHQCFCRPTIITLKRGVFLQDQRAWMERKGKEAEYCRISAALKDVDKTHSQCSCTCD